MFTICISGKPTSPNRLTYSETSSSSTRISWNKPSDEGASSITRYIVHWKAGELQTHNKHPVLVMKLDPPKISMTITGLMPNTEYAMWVVAMNKQGLSEKKNVYTVTTLARSESRLLVNDIALCSVYDLIVSSCFVFIFYIYTSVVEPDTPPQLQVGTASTSLSSVKIQVKKLSSSYNTLVFFICCACRHG